MYVIIVNGAAKNGKDNFVKFFINNYDFKAVNWSTIDKVKEIAKKNFGWDNKKTNEARKFLSEIKRVWGEYNNGPFNYMTNKIDNHFKKLNKKNKNNIIYFIHCREPYEIQKFKDKYKENCLTILLKRDDREVPDNDADRNVNNYNYDKIIQNNGNKIDFQLEAIKYVEEFKNLKK